MASSTNAEETQAPDRTPWIWSSGSNVHVASSRELFTIDYISFNSYYERPDGRHVQVIGIGTVELEGLPLWPGCSIRHRIRLEKVLHALDAPFNIMGKPLLDNYIVGSDTGWLEEGGIYDQSNVLAAFDYPECPGVFKIDLPSYAPHEFSMDFMDLSDLGRENLIQAHWPHSERHRFENTNSNLVAQVIGRAQGNEDAEDYDDYESVIEVEEGKARLNSEEIAWQRENYKTEFYLLRYLGLSYWREEDRQVGRAYVRKMMRRERMFKEALDNCAKAVEVLSLQVELRRRPVTLRRVQEN
ncbi:hypothetical protein FDECE_14118 [Fusarium decemcellulare]|nr:hypothetical protein FDECE_14118 [Fusarium decemcellulare]